MLVIIGSGMAGYAMVKAWRRFKPDAPCCMITADDGCVYAKPMLSTALSKNQSPDDLVQFTAESMMETLNIDIITHTSVRSLDVHRRLVEWEGGACEYTQLVLACGVRPFMPPWLGDGVSDIFQINHLNQYRYWREHLEQGHHILVIGGGLVGTEMVHDLCVSHHPVTWIHDHAWPLQHLIPKPMGEAMIEAFKERGVTWNGSRSVSRVDREGSGYGVHAGGDTWQGDRVLSATGLRPDLDWIREAGIACGQGVLIDAKGQTSVPSVYAIGDVAEAEGRLRYYVAALRLEADVVARQCAGQQDALLRYPVQPVVVKTPLIPLMVCPPRTGEEGSWTCEGDRQHMVATFQDQRGQLKGFALMGGASRMRGELVAQLQAWYDTTAGA